MDYLAAIAVIEKLLKERSVEGYEIMLGTSRNLSVEVKEQKVDTFKCSTPVGVSIRVLRNGGMGFSYSTSLEERALSRMIDNAVIGAASQTPDEFYGFPEPQTYREMPDIFDGEMAGVDEAEKVARAMELERLALAFDPRVKRVRKATYGESNYEVMIVNSRGVRGSYRGTSVSSSVSVVAEEGDDSQMGWDFGFSPRFSGVDVAAVAASAASKAVGGLGARRISTMRCPVVLDNHVATEFLEVLAPSFLAEHVLKQKSLLAGRTGELLFAPCLSIRDDGTLSGGMATTPFDGEGVAHRNTTLVAEGVVQGFLYDTLYARKLGTDSTGNSTRGGVKGAPHMGVTNFFIENGRTPPADLCAGIERGMLITDVIGMHTANPISGDFSVGAAGFLIEGGTITAPVRGVAIAGNVIELFRNVEQVGNDLRFYGSVGAPALRIAALDVSGE
ncbi:TldD/PmbA family protein [Geobacter sp. DSM 9736]|uniref:TldD/PmbA family protein n=1 Tax=Geobacter sp. DSM 9736 TaxID=1277350 RepID=UPI000B50AFAA|nr:TldD/PmbA family protein [Geobacter sp. DSM 9736]SNB46212.1 PmbA protein [Geobacter sp. DSM 9736]